MWSCELSVSISLLIFTAFRASEDEIQTGLPWSESLTKSNYNHSCSCTKLSWFGKARTVQDCLWNWWEKLEPSLSLLWHRCLSLREYFEDDCSPYVRETEVEISPAKKDVTSLKKLLCDEKEMELGYKGNKWGSMQEQHKRVGLGVCCSGLTTQIPGYNPQQAIPDTSKCLQACDMRRPSLKLGSVRFSCCLNLLVALRILMPCTCWLITV